MRARRGTLALAGACLAAGIAIGVAVPRSAPIEPTRHRDQVGPERDPPRSAGRNVYSPVILRDEYVRRRHLALVDALERQCRATGGNCSLAAAARRAATEPR